jgi:gluconate 5-dehydrogenase
MLRVILTVALTALLILPATAQDISPDTNVRDLANEVDVLQLVTDLNLDMNQVTYMLAKIGGLKERKPGYLKKEEELLTSIKDPLTQMRDAMVAGKPVPTQAEAEAAAKLVDLQALRKKGAADFQSAIDACIGLLTPDQRRTVSRDSRTIMRATAMVNRIRNAGDSEWQQVMDTNVRGTFLCCKHVGKIFKEKKKGKIVTISSVRAFAGHPGGYAAYGTSKGAVNLLTKQLATEWAKYSINVNSIAPCIFWTPLTQEVLENEQLYKVFMSRIPMGRAALTQDSVGAAVYLSSPASDFVTGQILYVDGGTVAG